MCKVYCTHFKHNIVKCYSYNSYVIYFIEQPIEEIHSCFYLCHHFICYSSEVGSSETTRFYQHLLYIFSWNLPVRNSEMLNDV